MAFFEARSLPAAVVGPQDLHPLAREAAIWAALRGGFAPGAAGFGLSDFESFMTV
jgi:hypothetical protein